jgi:hypothetical protein
MEPHPVPQDILNTEFKLFGSFTLKQFLKLVMGCLMALFFFLINIPAIIKWPLIGISILLGVALAIVPRFGVWLGNYLKAIFITPRYVWMQTNQPPELLTAKTAKKNDKSQKVSSTKSKKKVNLDEISLERLLATKDDPRKSTPLPQGEDADELDDPSRQSNLDRIMGDVFKNQKSVTSSPKVQQAVVSSPVNMQQNVGAQNQESSESQQPQKSKQQFINEINDLKKQLHNLVKDQNYKEKEADLLHRINDLMHELNMIDSDGQSMDQLDVKPQLQNGEHIVNAQGVEDIDGQIVFGIVVDKQNNPVSDATVTFDGEGTNDITLQTAQDGKFTTPRKLKYGDYAILVQHPNMSFHRYQITVSDEKLPAYKLRAK